MLDHEKLIEKLSVIGYDGSHPNDDKIKEALLAVAVTLDSYNLPEEVEEVVIDLLTKEVRNKIEHLPDIQEDSWENFNYGNVSVGHFVRVKKDAYDSPLGEKHNGLVGVLSYMAAGRCTVNYIGLSSGKSHKHAKEKLESLKLGVQ